MSKNPNNATIDDLNYIIKTKTYEENDEIKLVDALDNFNDLIKITKNRQDFQKIYSLISCISNNPLFVENSYKQCVCKILTSASESKIFPEDEKEQIEVWKRIRL